MSEEIEAPLSRALRLVEDLIRERMAQRFAEGHAATEPKAKRALFARADELGLVVREIRKARGEGKDE